MGLEVIKFSAVWCGPCRILTPIFSKIENSTPNVQFSHVDIDDDPQYAQQMGVMAVPTILFLKDGVVVDTLVGLQKELAIVEKINMWK